MVVGHQKIIPDLQRFQQHEGQNGHLQSEGEGQHLVQDLKLDKGLKEKQFEWSDFKKYFKKQYLSESYYERKTIEFYTIRLGEMMMEDLINKFLELLRSAPYIL